MTARLLTGIALLAVLAPAQDFTYRGFIETRSFFYPRDVPGDSANYVGESLLRFESSVKLLPNLRLNAWIDGRFDSHRQFDREFRLDFADRRLQRPALSMRRLSVLWNKGPLTVEAGRQFIRWGKADILNPTDRFAPRDFLNVFSTDFLGVSALRITFEKAGDTVDAVYQPYFTPSRSPLLNQRWVVLPPEVRQFPIDDRGFLFPGRGPLGMRWNHIGGGYEMSLSFYDGFNHLPLIDAALRPAPVPEISLQRYFAHMRMYGADAAVPLTWFTLKGEAAYFTSSTLTADEYLQYVIQAERIFGEWAIVGGYAGESVTTRRNPLDFAPDRGITKTFLGRMSYNIDANRSVAFEGALRQNGDGAYGKWEYSKAIGQRWRAIGSFTLIRGKEDDFIGQFRRNSHFQIVLRYSF